MSEGIVATTCNKLSRKQKITVILAVGAMWAASMAFDAYLRWDLERYRVDTQNVLAQNKADILDKIFTLLNEDDQVKINKRLGSPVKD